MNWHIIGASGYIGTKLRSYLPDDIVPYCYDVQDQKGMRKIDLTKVESFDFSPFKKGDFVVFLSAISLPDVCRDQYDFAYSINVTGTKAFLRNFSEKGVHVLFFSSDVVYGMTSMEKLTEESECHPCGPYAEMKYEIEKAFEDDPNIKMFRLSYVFSNEDKYSRYLTKCVENGETAEVFDSLYRSVIYINDIFDAIIALAQKFESFENKVFNLSGPDLLSRLDMAHLYRQTVNEKLQYVAVEPPEGFFEARPPIIATKSLYLEKLLGRSPIPLTEAYIREYKNEGEE